MLESFDCVILGGGHNGLTSAAYLAKANKSVLVIEALEETGGAAVSVKPFKGLDANLSRYSYLVSLLPQQIIDDLDLKLNLISRTIGSYTPVNIDGKETGLLVERTWGERTKESFKSVTGSMEEFDTWSDFYSRIEKAAQVIAPTMLNPLISQEELKQLVIEATDQETYDWLFTIPITETIEKLFKNDVVRGVVLTDALIGTFTDGRDKELLGNRCFLYHLIGNGNGEWKVPQGGMGQVSKALAQKAISLGAQIRTNSKVTKVVSDGKSAHVTYIDKDGTKQVVTAKFVLSNFAPSILNKLLGKNDNSKDEGCQVKINMLLTRLPILKSGEDPTLAFRGTLHVNEKLTELDKSFQEAISGQIPTTLPSEIYCHTLTDNSILSKELQDKGYHTITLFGLNTPAALFDKDNNKSREKVKELYLAGLNSFFTEKIEDCIAKDIDGNLCIEVKTPQDIAESVFLPRGNIFHRELQWPFAETTQEIGKWGVETDIANIFICGAGAKRGGAVSGIPGRNAAQAVLMTGLI
jgi:phytoene dehydrogenase-like protein